MQARATELRCADWIAFEAFKKFSFCFVQNVPSNSGIMENIHYNEILGITPIKLLYYFSPHKTLPPTTAMKQFIFVETVISLFIS